MIIPYDTLNQLVALSAVWMEVAAVVLLGIFVIRNKYQWTRDVSGFVGKWGLWLGALLTLATIVVSLYYSEYLGFVPCGLCWTIRIFAYSQFFVFVTAAWRGDHSAWLYSLVLSVPGLVVALYQHYLQMGGSELVACPTAGEGADCSARFLYEFGHVTFPWLAVALFGLLIVVMLFVRLHAKQSKAA